jgi:hypothetical protein
VSHHAGLLVWTGQEEGHERRLFADNSEFVGLRRCLMSSLERLPRAAK